MVSCILYNLLAILRDDKQLQLIITVLFHSILDKIVISWTIINLILSSTNFLTLHLLFHRKSSGCVRLHSAYRLFLCIIEMVINSGIGRARSVRSKTDTIRQLSIRADENRHAPAIARYRIIESTPLLPQFHSSSALLDINRCILFAMLKCTNSISLVMLDLFFAT